MRLIDTKVSNDGKNILNDLVKVLTEKGPMTAGQLGLELWWRPNLVGKTENATATMFCRPAGKLLRRANKLSLVRYEDKGKTRIWHLREGYKHDNL